MSPITVTRSDILGDPSLAAALFGDEIPEENPHQAIPSRSETIFSPGISLTEAGIRSNPFTAWWHDDFAFPPENLE